MKTHFFCFGCFKDRPLCEMGTPSTIRAKCKKCIFIKTKTANKAASVEAMEKLAIHIKKNDTKGSINL